MILVVLHYFGMYCEYLITRTAVYLQGYHCHLHTIYRCAQAKRVRAVISLASSPLFGLFFLLLVDARDSCDTCSNVARHPFLFLPGTINIFRALAHPDQYVLESAVQYLL